MNKSTLFLFSIFSTINFSCGAMEMIKYHAHVLSNNTFHVFNHVLGTEAQSHQEIYKQSLQNFNENAEEYKKDPTASRFRLHMADNLKPIRQEILFITNFIKAEDNRYEESLRLPYIDTVIKKLSAIDKELDSKTIAQYQNVINIIANFSVKESENRNDTHVFTSSAILCGKKILQESDIELLNNPELSAVFKLKEKEVAKRKEDDNKHYKRIELQKQKQAIQNQIDPENQKIADFPQDKVAESIKTNQEVLAELKDEVIALNLQVTLFKNAKETWEKENKELTTKLTDQETIAKDLQDKLNSAAVNLKNKMDASQLERLTLEQRLTSLYFKIKVGAGVGIAACLAYYFNLYSKCLELLNRA